VSPGDQPQVDPDLADAVRRAYVRPVDHVTATRHLSAIMAAASAGGEYVARRSRVRRRAWRPIVAAAAATLLLPAGLAVAGVNLPDVVERPYRAVGLEVPHHTRPAAAPAMRTVAPVRTPTSPARPRPAEQPARHSQARHGQRDRAERQANPVDRRTRRNSPRSPSARSARSPAAHVKQHGPNPHRAIGREQRPASPKTSARPKEPKSQRTPRTDKGRPR
jgi:hypothetical protein